MHGIMETIEWIIDKKMVHVRRGHPLDNNIDRIFTSMMEEAGELVQAHRKTGLPDEASDEEVEEAADCLIALLHFATARHISADELEDKVRHKLLSSFRPPNATD